MMLLRGLLTITTAAATLTSLLQHEQFRKFSQDLVDGNCFSDQSAQIFTTFLQRSLSKYCALELVFLFLYLVVDPNFLGAICWYYYNRKLKIAERQPQGLDLPPDAQQSAKEPKVIEMAYPHHQSPGEDQPVEQRPLGTEQI